MKYDTVENETPKIKTTKLKKERLIQVREAMTPKPKIMTSSLVIDEVIKALNPLELLNPDEIRLREILTAQRGNVHRNETYQRNNIIKPFIEFLIKNGWIKI